MKSIDALSRAIELFGSQTSLAKAAGVSQHAIWRSLKVGTVTASLAIKIELATRGKIKRGDLCPMLNQKASR